MDRREILADAIRALTYEEIQDFAAIMRDACTDRMGDKNFDVNDVSDWADLIHVCAVCIHERDQ